MVTTSPTSAGPISKPDRVWIIDDDHAIRWVLEKALQRDQIIVSTFENGLGAMSALNQEHAGY